EVLEPGAHGRRPAVRDGENLQGDAAPPAASGDLPCARRRYVSLSGVRGACRDGGPARSCIVRGGWDTIGRFMGSVVGRRGGNSRSCSRANRGTLGTSSFDEGRR